MTTSICSFIWKCKLNIIEILNIPNNTLNFQFSGVPLRDKFLQIPHKPSRMNGPFRGTSIAGRLGPSQFDTGSGRVDIALVKHRPMSTGRTSGVYKDDRPVSFIFVPSAGFKWQVMNKAPAVWCKRFDGSTIEDFLEDLFRDQTKRACVISDFFSGKGRAVQMWNSLRYLEASCRLCKAMSGGEIRQDELEFEGHSLFRLLFAQTGWILLEPGMVKATEGNPVPMGTLFCTNGCRASLAS